MRRDPARLLRVAALIVGVPKASSLWTLRALADLPIDLRVVRAAKGSRVTRRQRTKSLILQHGVVATASRVAGSALFGRWDQRTKDARLDTLFDAETLRAWWRDSGITPVQVSHLNNPDSHQALDTIAPDVIVRVSGGILKTATFSRARLATLNIHHGIAPDIRGMWSIPWGLIEGRADWIGATVHLIDEGIDTGDVLWRGGPQVALGDTGDDLFFRSHLLAVQALCRVVLAYAGGETPAAVGIPADIDSQYRTAPGLQQWIAYWWSRRGARSRVVRDSVR